MIDVSPPAAHHLNSPKRVRGSVASPAPALGAEKILVIGYGNELRGDDGVGPRLAREVAAWQRPGVRCLVCHQLTPELVDELAAARRVLFVDAALDLCPGQMAFKRLVPAAQTSGLGHVSPPAWLLALTHSLHGACPPAWLLTLGAASLGFGERLSGDVEQVLASVLVQIEEFVDGNHEQKTALQLRVRGQVQGVGFRPYVQRTAVATHLTGWVANDGEGVLIHVEGCPKPVEAFRRVLSLSPPAAAFVTCVEEMPAVTEGCEGFAIRSSRTKGPTRSVRVPPDRAVCPACLAEMSDPANRRHGYPLTTCTDCGPRYSILERLPYDRPATTMGGFTVCPACCGEYDDRASRRCHAQTISCSACGPQVTWLDPRTGGRQPVAEGIPAAARLLGDGQVLAVKGIGGYQLLVRADASAAIQKLRQRKHRPTKPFAVMVPSLGEADRVALVTPAARRWLTSPENPIVLLERRGTGKLAPEVAPQLNRVGVFLPTTPLHHLLLAETDFPVVATSGNRRDEPIAVNEAEAHERLAGLADGFLEHDRPICRRVDDSVMRLVGERPVMIRLGRGFAPLPLPALEKFAVPFKERIPSGVLATGGQQKVAVALWNGTQAILGPHVGDLDELDTRSAFTAMTGSLADLYQCQLAALACDLHPDFPTTRWSEQQNLPLVRVAHHHAHAVVTMIEHDLLDREVLAFTWDGTGQGPDGTIWGGEVLRATASGYRRVASLRLLPLPGGEAAIREPGRLLPWIFRQIGLETGAAALIEMVERGVNTPWTSSVGRLFDAAAACLLEVRRVSYEGEAAAWLEAVVDPDVEEAYPLPLLPDETPPRGDWRPLFAELVEDQRKRVPVGVCAARFHNAFAAWAAAVAEQHPGLDVVLGGGCFQNAWLLRRTREALERKGRRVFGPEMIPPGDGGLAAGQLAVALAILAERSGRIEG